jgi:hypothetical protein
MSIFEHMDSKLQKLFHTNMEPDVGLLVRIKMR